MGWVCSFSEKGFRKNRPRDRLGTDGLLSRNSGFSLHRAFPNADVFFCRFSYVSTQGKLSRLAAALVRVLCLSTVSLLPLRGQFKALAVQIATPQWITATHFPSTFAPFRRKSYGV
jgi:hypothetical protein